LFLLQVWAKRRFKTPLKYLRAKYKREFELNEKIVSSTLWARLEPNGRLVVGAVAKRQAPQPQTQTSDQPETAEPVATGSEPTNDPSTSAENVTSHPPETAAAECPDILVTCHIAADEENGRCNSPDKD